MRLAAVVSCIALVSLAAVVQPAPLAQRTQGYATAASELFDIRCRLVDASNELVQSLNANLAAPLSADLIAHLQAATLRAHDHVESTWRAVVMLSRVQSEADAWQLEPLGSFFLNGDRALFEQDRQDLLLRAE